MWNKSTLERPSQGSRQCKEMIQRHRWRVRTGLKSSTGVLCGARAPPACSCVISPRGMTTNKLLFFPFYSSALARNESMAGSNKPTLVFAGNIDSKNKPLRNQEAFKQHSAEPPHPLIPILYVPWVGEGCIACKRITVIWLLNGEYNILDTVSFGQIIISSLLVFAEIAWRKKSTSEITDVAHFTCWNSHKRKRGLRGAYHMEAAAPGTLLFPDSLQHISCLSQLERWKLTCSENPVIYWFQWLLSRNYSYKWFTVML